MTGWVHAVLDLPAGSEAATHFWTAALGWPLGEPWPGHPELSSFAPPSGDAYVHRQTVSGPAGVHLDVEVDDVAAETARLGSLGAVPVRRTDGWQTLRSPGGLDFCLVPARPRTRPEPVTAPGGHRRRLVQVCVDLPVGLAAAEAQFWRVALGWPEVQLDEPEFLGRLVPPPGASLQVLLQRLGDDDGGRTPRVHLDLGADDLDSEVARLIGLGARRIAPGAGFVALSDPSGTAFCVTRNSPDAP